MKSLAIFFGLLIAAAVAHDGYVAYTHPEMGQLPQSFHFSDLGWLWETYSPDTLKSAKEFLGDDNFKTFLDPILSQRTVFIAAIPLIVLLIFMGVRFLIERTRLAQAGGQAGNYKDSASVKQSRVHYRRR